MSKSVKKQSIARASGYALAASFLTFSVAGCASPPDSRREPLRNDLDRPRGMESSASSLAGSPLNQQNAQVQQPSGGQFGVPTIGSSEAAPVISGNANAPRARTGQVDAVVPPLPLPQFIDVVFGDMLGVPYVTGAGVAARTELVQLRSSGRIASSDFIELVAGALREYGIAVTVENGAYQIVEDSVLRSRIPRFIRSRATATTPSELRPVVMFVPLNAAVAGEMQEILKKAFPNETTLKVDVNPRINTITLTGLPRDVDAALAIISQMDELAYAGTTAERYTPVYWSATELGRELNRLLSAEGWQSSDNASVQRAILIMPIQFSNDLVVFAKDPAALARARFWLSQLDRPTNLGDAPQLYIYEVRNVDAELLASTVNAVLTGQQASTASAAAAAPTPGAPPVQPTAQPVGATNMAVRGGIVVDKISNRLVFSGTAADYNRLLPLLQQLDRPAGEVLIQVTIAEITLTDETRFGVEFFASEFTRMGNGFTVGTSGLGVGGDGLSIGILSGNIDATINAMATNSQINVLSKPRIVARSGSAAQIQVGRDVPIITSQRASNNQTGGQTDVLQSVDYRSTGVLMSIEPIIFSRDRVDLTISQEVSTAESTTTASIASPTISTRNLSTQLSLEDGHTVVLGGLMQDNVTQGNSGIPLLKDIPIAGQLFRNDSVSQTRTELLVMITAYILRGGDDKAHFTDTLVNQLRDAYANPDNGTTLLPFNQQGPLFDNGLGVRPGGATAPYVTPQPMAPLGGPQPGQPAGPSPEPASAIVVPPAQPQTQPQPQPQPAAQPASPPPASAASTAEPSLPVNDPPN